MPATAADPSVFYGAGLALARGFTFQSIGAGSANTGLAGVGGAGDMVALPQRAGRAEATIAAQIVVTGSTVVDIEVQGSIDGVNFAVVLYRLNIAQTTTVPDIKVGGLRFTRMYVNANDGTVVGTLTEGA